MKVYTYSEAREKLAAILEESKTDEVVIKRRKGDTYAIVPQQMRPRRSPFDVAGINDPAASSSRIQDNERSEL